MGKSKSHEYGSRKRTKQAKVNHRIVLRRYVPAKKISKEDLNQTEFVTMCIRQNNHIIDMKNLAERNTSTMEKNTSITEENNSTTEKNISTMKKYTSTSKKNTSIRKKKTSIRKKNTSIRKKNTSTTKKNTSTKKKNPSTLLQGRRAPLLLRKMQKKNMRSADVHFKTDETLDSTFDLPIISTVHGSDYFEKHPFSMQPFADNEVQFEMKDSTIIKTESCDKDDILYDEMNKSVMKTIPEELLHHHLKDHNILPCQSNNSDFNFMELKAQKISFDKENELLIDVIRYLDECAKADKFDIAGKLYAAKLRSVMFTNQQAIAENLCRQVLLEAEHFNLDEKIVLSKQHPRDYLSNRKNHIEEAKKSNSEQSFYLQLEKTALLQNIQNRLSESNKEDRFDKFGKLYATKMRSFSDIQYFYADKLINEIVLEAELCHLRANFKLSKLGDPPSHSFTTGKSYAKIYRTKVPIVPSSDITCATNQSLLRQTDQLPVETIKNSVDQQFICSLKPTLTTLSPTLDVNSIKNSVQPFPKSNSDLKPAKPKKTIREYSKIHLIEDSGKKGSMNISFTLPIDSLTLTSNVISVQNNVHNCEKSLPYTLPDIFLNTPIPKKTRQSTICRFC